MPPRASSSSAVASNVRDAKLALPAFLQMLTAGGMPMDKAIAAASKIYKTCNTPASLGHLTDGTLTALHIDEKEQRKLVLAAVKKAGYKNGSSGSGSATTIKDPAAAASSVAAALAAKSRSSTSNIKQKASPKKRKRDDNLNEFLPEGPHDEAVEYGSFDFDELLDEQALMTKFTIVNRAPVMTAWAMVVAERLGFKREEALSIASVYTEMNATSKGVRLGILEEGKGKGVEATQGGGQPYVDFMGRRPVFSTQSSQWRALLKGEPVSPSSAFKYITNALRQTTGHIVGAMRLLAKTYSPQELNRIAFSLYADFRPQVDGWGKRGEVKCEAILGARRPSVAVREGEAGLVHPASLESAQEPDMKKPKVEEMSVEEYEAALDDEGYEGIFAGDA